MLTEPSGLFYQEALEGKVALGIYILSMKMISYDDTTMVSIDYCINYAFFVALRNKLLLCNQTMGDLPGGIDL